MSVELLPIGDAYGDYLRDESRRPGKAELIAFPRDEDQVKTVISLARQRSLHITLQGARTGIAAGAVPFGGVVMNLSRMDRIAVTEGSPTLVVQPGVLLTALRDAIAPAGRFFPPDPTETSASIGGMLASNASGALSYHYGSTRSWVQRIRVVLADGDVLELRRGERADGRHFSLKTDEGGQICGELPDITMPNVKSAAGYHISPGMELIDLFIGMEGTLGVITEAELRTLPDPPAKQALCAFFPDEASALKFVRILRGESNVVLPLSPVAIEFFDSHALDLLRRAKAEHPAFQELPALPEHFDTAIYFEFHGEDEEQLEDAVMAVAEPMVALGASDDECWLASTAAEIAKLKTFRHATPEAVNLVIDERRKTCPELTKLGTDMSVPDSELEHILEIYRSGLKKQALEHVVFGHVGNNHLHVNILPHTLDDYARGKGLYRQWARNVVAMGGSVSAEHGIGKLKTALLREMFGDEGVASMQLLKQLFDPDGILNPGNLFE